MSWGQTLRAPPGICGMAADLRGGSYAGCADSATRDPIKNRRENRECLAERPISAEFSGKFPAPPGGTDLSRRPSCRRTLRSKRCPWGPRTRLVASAARGLKKPAFAALVPTPVFPRAFCFAAYGLSSGSAGSSSPGMSGGPSSKGKASGSVWSSSSWVSGSWVSGSCRGAS